MSGYYGDQAVPDLQGKSYIALFHSSGKLIKELHEPSVPETDLQKIHKQVPEGGALFADDGNLYLLHGRGILVISSSGEIIHRIMYEKPDKDSIASRFMVSGGYIAIWFFQTDKNDTTHSKFLVIDRTTEEPLGLYTPEEGLYNAVCFSRKEGFTFIAAEKERIKLQTAALQ